MADLNTRINDLATAIGTDMKGKVDKVSGKTLSTNDYTNEDKEKINNIVDKSTAIAYAIALG